MNGLLVDKVIHNFKYIAVSVETGQKILIVVSSFKETVKQGKRKSRANVGFRNTMLERGLAENIVDKHTLRLYCTTG
jgi:hypothetical protein